MEINIPKDQLAFLCWLLSEIVDNVKFECGDKAADEEADKLLNDLIKTINNRLEIEQIINGEAFLDEEN
jgi:hypothetical protein